MNDGSFLNAGRSRYGTVVYNTVANTYEVTNDSDNDAVITVLTEAGLVGVSVLASGASSVIQPASIQIDGSAPIMDFDTRVGVLNDGSGNCKIWADKTGGPQYQGYAVRAASGSNLPAILAADLNGIDAIEFVAANSEALEGERRRDWQGLSQYTLITVTTGAYVGQASAATNHIQQALSGASFFLVNATGGAGFGSHAGTATYLVRSTIFNGSLADNATRLVGRQNKVAQTLSFTGTIPALTENTASVFRLGRRAYDATYLGGKDVRIVLLNVALADIGDKEDVLKSEYAI